MDWILVLVPIIAAMASLLTWLVRSRLEDIRREHERLHETRRAIYLKNLDPMIRMFAGVRRPAEMRRATESITSVEHRRTMFELNLMGSDDVVRAVNAFQQHMYQHGGEDTVGLMSKWSNLLLAIRKDLGNKRSKLKPVEMLRSQITDIDKFMNG